MQALCQCGCGEPAPIAVQDHPKYGWVKGQPLKYVRGHNNRGRHLKTTRYLVEDRGYKTPCWIWQLAAYHGYGSISVGRKPYRAHRYYWEQVHGPVPAGKHLDHLCRVTLCVNPDHLEPVSNAENTRRGASTKLTVADVHAIRALLAEGRVKQVVIAGRFGVSPATVTDIKKGRKWADV